MALSSPQQLKRSRDDAAEGILSEQQLSVSKKQKTKRQWQVPKTSTAGADGGEPSSWNIEPGDAGIWATCAMGKEAKCVGELRDLFNDAAEELYGDSDMGKQATRASSKLEEDASIEDELEELRNPARQEPWFSHVRVDVQCVIFFRCNSPAVDPTAVVCKICHEALATAQSVSSGALARKTRFIKRLTPQTRMCKASEAALLQTAEEVLGPHFPVPSRSPSPFPSSPSSPSADPATTAIENNSSSDNSNGGIKNEAREDAAATVVKRYAGKTFAIRPSLRNHSRQLSRENIIRSVANLIAQRNHPLALPTTSSSSFPSSSAPVSSATATAAAAPSQPQEKQQDDAQDTQAKPQDLQDKDKRNMKVKQQRRRLYRVNLNDPDILILVEVYRSIAGIVALDAREWERCKRFNLSEIFAIPATGPTTSGYASASALGSTGATSRVRDA